MGAMALRVFDAVEGVPLFGTLVLLDPKGTIALQQRDIMLTATVLMLTVVIPVLILTAVIAWRYRASNTKARYLPNWDHNKMEEFVWWGVPTIIIGILAVITWQSSHVLDPFRPLASPKNTLVIRVIALDWKWLFLYPEQNIATVNFIQIPEDRPIRFEITADAPMNSFWIPQLAGQIYAMAGMVTQLHIEANEPGDYAGASANFSGAGFAGMKFTVRASSEKEFDQWVQSVQTGSAVLDRDTYGSLMEPSVEEPARFYAGTEPGLFEYVLDKFTKPPRGEGKTENMYHN